MSATLHMHPATPEHRLWSLRCFQLLAHLAKLSHCQPLRSWRLTPSKSLNPLRVGNYSCPGARESHPGLRSPAQAAPSLLVSPPLLRGSLSRKLSSHQPQEDAEAGRVLPPGYLKVCGPHLDSPRKLKWKGHLSITNIIISPRAAIPNRQPHPGVLPEGALLRKQSARTSPSNSL